MYIHIYIYICNKLGTLALPLWLTFHKLRFDPRTEVGCKLLTITAQAGWELISIVCFGECLWTDEIMVRLMHLPNSYVWYLRHVIFCNALEKGFIAYFVARFMHQIGNIFRSSILILITSGRLPSWKGSGHFNWGSSRNLVTWPSEGIAKGRVRWQPFSVGIHCCWN